jgi:hypothetical protein
MLLGASVVSVSVVFSLLPQLLIKIRAATVVRERILLRILFVFFVSKTKVQCFTNKLNEYHHVEI